MEWSTFALFIAVSIVPAISPGPGILLAVSNTLRFGRSATLWSALGNALGLFILGIAIALGLGSLMAASATAFTVLKLIGAVYLAYLGFKVWRDRSLLSNDLGLVQPAKSRTSLFFQALLVSLTNPKAILVLVALFPPFMDQARPLAPQILIMSFSYALLCYVNHLFLALLAGHVRRLVSSDRRMRWVRRVTGGAFVSFGVALAASTNR